MSDEILDGFAEWYHDNFFRKEGGFINYTDVPLWIKEYLAAIKYFSEVGK